MNRMARRKRARWMRGTYKNEDSTNFYYTKAETVRARNVPLWWDFTSYYTRSKENTRVAPERDATKRRKKQNKILIGFFFAWATADSRAMAHNRNYFFVLWYILVAFHLIVSRFFLRLKISPKIMNEFKRLLYSWYQMPQLLVIRY